MMLYDNDDDNNNNDNDDNNENNDNDDDDIKWNCRSQVKEVTSPKRVCPKLNQHPLKQPIGITTYKVEMSAGN